MHNRHPQEIFLRLLPVIPHAGSLFQQVTHIPRRPRTGQIGPVVTVLAFRFMDKGVGLDQSRLRLIDPEGLFHKIQDPVNTLIRHTQCITGNARILPEHGIVDGTARVGAPVHDHIQRDPDIIIILQPAAVIGALEAQYPVAPREQQTQQQEEHTALRQVFVPFRHLPLFQN